MEIGLYLKLYDDFGRETSGLLEASNKLYTKLQSLRDEFTEVTNLDLEYFEKLFVYLSAFYLLLCVGFAVRFSFKPVFRALKRLQMTVVEYRINLQLKFTFKLPICKFQSVYRLRTLSAQPWESQVETFTLWVL